MDVYLSAYMQCYEKAAAHLEQDVLPKVDDSQTRQGIQFCIQHAKQEATNIRQIGEEAEKLQ